MESAGDRLKHARAYLGHSQEVFCSMLGLSYQSYLSDLENGRRTISNDLAVSIEEKTGISSDYILKGIGEMLLSEGQVVQKKKIKQHLGTPAERLKLWRKSKNLTQKEVADRIDYKQSSISATEKRAPGNVARELASKLEKEFGLSRIWLLEGVGTMEQETPKLNITEAPTVEYKAKQATIDQSVLDRIESLETDMKLVKKMLSNDR